MAVLETAHAAAVCFDAPTVELLETRVLAINPVLSRLGGDVARDDFDVQAALVALRDPACGHSTARLQVPELPVRRRAARRSKAHGAGRPHAHSGRPMRLGFDLRIMRYPPGGTASYARIAMERLAAGRPADWEVVGLRGWPRLGHASSLPPALRRATNAALDIGWLGWGAPWEMARNHLDAWFTPASILPLTVPRPTVTVMHNLAFLVVPELFESHYRKATERLHRLSVMRATRIITPSEFLRAIVIDRLGAAPERVRTIPWGMDHLPVAAQSSGVDVAGPYALFIGQTQPHWNVGALIDAWQRDVPDELSLVISGAAGAQDGELRRRVERAGLAGRVRFTGLLAPERLMALIRDARLFVDPSLAEGFGKPVIETMLLGIPCAVAARGALPEVTQGGALVFDPEDADGLADVITRLHEDDALRRRLRAKGPKVARQYVWAQSVAGYWEEIRAALAEHRR